MNTLTVRVREEADATGFTHPDAQNHYDWMVWIGDAGWATPQGNGWVAQSPFTPNDSNAPVFYRLLLPWATTAAQGQNPQLLGHNGKHSLSLVQVNGVDATMLGFEPVMGGPAYGRGPAPAYANVQNLAFTSISPQDYFVLGAINPQTGQRSPNAPAIVINLADNNLSSPMNVEVTIRATPDPTTIVRTLSLYSVTGSRQSVQWDGKNDQGQAADAGCYTFDVKVTQPADADAITYRSSFLQVIQENLSLVTDGDDNAVVLDSNNLATAHITYGLNEPPAPNSVVVRLIDSALNVQQTANGLSDQVRDDTNPVTLQSQMPDFTQSVAPFRVLITGADTHKATYRDHQNKLMLPHNKLRMQIKRKTCFEYVLNNQTTSPLREMKRDFLAAIAGNIINQQDPTWSDIKDWTATSGSGPWQANTITHTVEDWRNKIKYEWDGPNQPNLVGGPTPRNATHQSSERPSRIGSRQAASNGMYVWQNQNDEGNFTKTHTNFKYLIGTNGGNQVHHKDGHPSIQRGTDAGMYIHSDGGELGTIGCIGVGNRNYPVAKAVDDRLKSLYKTGKDIGNGIPLYVRGNDSNYDYTNDPANLPVYIYRWIEQ